MLVARSDGRYGCELDASPGDREFLGELVREIDEPEPKPPVLVAADPLSHQRGATRQALAVIAAIRKRYEKASMDERKGLQQAHPHVVADILAQDGLPPEPNEALNAPAIPPDGFDDRMPPPQPGEWKPVGSWRAERRRSG